MEDIVGITPATKESVWAALRETDRLLEKSSTDFDRRIRKLEELVGGISNNQGLVAEDYFFISFENGKKDFFGETFDYIERNIKGFEPGFKDEYDIVFVNGKSVAIVEVKFKAHENDIPKVVKKAETFRINFPKYKNHKIYLGLASMAFYPELEMNCKNTGIAIVKQDGGAVIIYDDNLKTF